MKDRYTVALPSGDNQKGNYEQIVYLTEEPESADNRTDRTDCKSYAEAFARATKDCNEGLADVIVAPSAELLIAEDQTFVMHIVGRRRFATLTDAATPADAVQQITQETLVERLTTIAQTLQRDFTVEHPRIALIGIEGLDNNILSQAITELGEKHIYAYGPLSDEDINNAEKLSLYDVLVGCCHSQMTGIATEYTNDMENTAVAYLANAPYICTADVVSASEEPQHAALYMAIDILRRRHEYDLSHANPLPKLYHERREDGDRPRFTQRKPEANANS